MTVPNAPSSCLMDRQKSLQVPESESYTHIHGGREQQAHSLGLAGVFSLVMYKAGTLAIVVMSHNGG